MTPGALAVEHALSRLGCRYRLRAAGPDRFDCTGLVRWAYGAAGVEVPLTYEPAEGALTGWATVAALAPLEPGDVVMLRNAHSRWTALWHTGLYVGGGQLVHAARPGLGVRLDPLPERLPGVPGPEVDVASVPHWFLAAARLPASRR